MAKDANPATKESSRPSKLQETPTTSKSELGGINISVKEQRQKDWKIIKNLLVNIWPANDWGVKGRVVLGLGLLIGAKASEVPPPCQS